MSQSPASRDAVKFAYWVPNVSGGLVVRGQFKNSREGLFTSSASC
ncbi:hypothetical protein KS03_5782 (plasmid) [Burkholderia glumae LMG 2196 = ATCC 33617]|nr:hypothetical protein KS03_5782 [Burkholderia glumae LMG 2196 = ATCC 33617]